MHPIDAHEDGLRGLLTELLQQHPELLIGRGVAKLKQGARYQVLAAAFEANDRRFDEAILAGLGDRSISVKELVFHAIADRASLRRPEVRQRLEALLA